MLLPKMKPGERVLLEVACVEDAEGRLSLMVDVIEKRPGRLKPVSKRRKPLTQRASVG